MEPPLRIAPSLLACDFGHLAAELARAEAAGADWHHVDVMDGHLVPNLTLGPPILAAIRAHATLPLDVHLMIERPEAWAQRYADAGADLLSFHYEAVEDRLPEAIAAFRRSGCKVGVAVDPPCPVEALRPHLDELDLILVMSVRAGFGGQSFLPEVLDKVRRIRDWGYDGDLEMDGGIGPETAARCAAAGANVLVAGTALYRAPDLAAALAATRAAAERGARGGRG